MRAFPILTLLAALALLTTACGAARPAAADKSDRAPREVTVTATEMAFSPAAIEATAGQPVKLTFRNNGMVEHNWRGQVDGETILVTAQPLQSASKTFTPRTPGTYKIVCSVPGHEQAGMVATLTVR
jgi:plastocyanin